VLTVTLRQLDGGVDIRLVDLRGSVCPVVCGQGLSNHVPGGGDGL
jgi:hypothetical protein